MRSCHVLTSSRVIPSCPAIIATSAIPRNRPFSTTPGICVKAPDRASGFFDVLKIAINDEIAIVGDKRVIIAPQPLAELPGAANPARKALDHVEGGFKTELNDFNWQWKLPPASAHICSHQRLPPSDREAVATIFSRNRAPPHALNEAQMLVKLVCAIKPSTSRWGSRSSVVSGILKVCCLRSGSL